MGASIRYSGPGCSGESIIRWTRCRRRKVRHRDLPRVVVDYYLSNLRLVNETGKHLGFAVLGYWQPTVYSREDAYPSELKRAQPWPGREGLLRRDLPSGARGG